MPSKIRIGSKRGDRRHFLTSMSSWLKDHSSAEIKETRGLFCGGVEAGGVDWLIEADTGEDEAEDWGVLDGGGEE